MRKSIHIILLLLFCAPLSILAQEDKDAELQRLDSLMKEFEKNYSVETAQKIISYKDDNSIDIIKQWKRDIVQCEALYAYSDYMCKFSCYPASLQYAKKCLDYALTTKDDEILSEYEGFCYSIMGVCYQRMGLFDKSIEYYEKCVECSKKLNSYADAAMDYGNIVNICCMITNNIESAKKYLDKALEMLKIAEQRKESKLHAGIVQSSVYNSAGKYYLLLGQYDKAYEYCSEACRLDSINGYENRFNSRKYEEAQILLKMGKEDLANSIFENLLEFYYAKKDIGKIANCLYSLRRYDDAIVNAQKVGDVALQVNILKELIFKETDISKVKEYTKEYIQLKDSLNSRANTLAMQGFNAEYDAQQREQTILQQKTALEKQRIKWYWAWSIAAMLVIVIVISVRGWVRDNRNKKRISKALADLEVASAELEKSNSDLEETNKVKDKLIRVISHDLSGSTSNVNMLAHMVADKMKDELSLMLVSQSDNLKSFFDDLLIWVKMQRTGSMEIHSTNLSLNQIADDVIKLIADTANGKELRLTHTIPAGTNIVADRSLVHCIIRNLVNNAVKFTPRGGSVTISFEQNTISVIDTGKGMTPDVVDMLLTGSQWVHTDGTEGEVGTGLGLSIVRDMVAMMKARLTIESEVGKGSVFSIHL